MSDVQTPRDAAMRFLQTVVVVDDHAYKRAHHVEESAVLTGESIDDESVEDPDDPAYDLAEDAEAILESQDFDTEVVVEGFADLGINCAVLAPDPNEHDADMRRIERLARRSDVVVLDWVINPRDPTKPDVAADDQTSLAFVEKILREDSAGGWRTRLICIYTGASEAGPILRAIVGAMSRGAEGAHAEHDGYVIDSGSTRVVVLGKERRFEVGTIESVASEDLPNRIVDEFTRFVANGMLREVALDSLSAVRDQSHRLLRRFDGQLDPALVSHRSTTSPAAADQFARGLVGAELEAIVLAAEVTGALADDRVREFIDRRLSTAGERLYWNPAGADASTKLAVDVARNALVLGIDEKEKVRESGKKFPPKISRTSLLLSGKEDVVRAATHSVDARFSMLSSLARDAAFDGEGAPAPELQLGVILSAVPSNTRLEMSSEAYDVEGPPPPRYWVCLQPLCDSVRLVRATRFPLLPLRRGSGTYNYVIEDDGGFVPLAHGGLKISEMSLESFLPNADSSTVRAKWQGAHWVFTSAGGVRFAWKGSLRLDKAHKLLQSVVTVAGRIGIDEYEYLRNAAGRE